MTMASGPKHRTKSEPRPLRTEAKESDVDNTPLVPRSNPWRASTESESSTRNSHSEGLSTQETSLARASGADHGPTNPSFVQGYDSKISTPRNRPREESQISPTNPSEDSSQTSYARARSAGYTPPLTSLQHYVRFLARVLSLFDFVSTRRAIRAPEWCDFESTPDRIRSICQDILTQQWTRRLPLLQAASPAEVACGQLASVIDEVAQLDKRELEVFEFCAGSGGPTPVFERLINQRRASLNQAPLQFSISDKYPNLDAWRRHTDASEHLRAIEESVDAAAPPSVALSCDSFKSAKEPPFRTSNSRILRLFNLSFHHFDDYAAVDILRSTMRTAHGIVIIELQDRRWGCLAMMAMNWLFVAKVSAVAVFATSPPAHGRMQSVGNFFRGMGTWLRVVFTLWWDGLASCLRTREFEELLTLAQGAANAPYEEQWRISRGLARECKIVESGFAWTWREHEMELHTFPYGYVKVFSGVRHVEGGGGDVEVGRIG